MISIRVSARQEHFQTSPRAYRCLVAFQDHRQDAVQQGAVLRLRDEMDDKSQLSRLGPDRGIQHQSTWEHGQRSGDEWPAEGDGMLDSETIVLMQRVTQGCGLFLVDELPIPERLRQSLPVLALALMIWQFVQGVTVWLTPTRFQVTCNVRMQGDGISGRISVFQSSSSVGDHRQASHRSGIFSHWPGAITLHCGNAVGSAASRIHCHLRAETAGIQGEALRV